MSPPPDPKPNDSKARRKPSVEEVLRPATWQDAEAIAILYHQVWSLEVEILGKKLAAERRADTATIQRWIAEDTYFVIEIADAIVAVIGCEARYGTLHLVHLATQPERRRQGLARQLMERAEVYAREIGAVKVWFDTAPGLEAASRLYEALGYRLCGRLQKHYWGTDIVLYEKLL